MKKNESPTDIWRWKLIRKTADYINQPDDINISELKALIDSYREYNEIKGYMSNNFN